MVRLRGQLATDSGAVSLLETTKEQCLNCVSLLDGWVLVQVSVDARPERASRTSTLSTCRSRPQVTPGMDQCQIRS
jgi:hypothetical protein